LNLERAYSCHNECVSSIIELEPYGTVTVPNSGSFHMCVFVGFDVNCVHCVHDLYALKVGGGG